MGELGDMGEVSKIDLNDNYVTFLAGIFRSVRFGASSAHGRANMIRFNFFKERNVFSRDEETGTYSVDFFKMQEAVDALSEKILVLQGNGDYEGVVEFIEKYGSVGETLQSDLDRLSTGGIPVDIVFNQGINILDLN